MSGDYISREAAIKALSHGDGCGHVCKHSIERIPAADVVERPRWIPVAERLPEPWEPVLVTYLSYNSHLPKADMLAYIDSDDGLWYWWDDTEPSGTKCIVTITHWMPLPEPPEDAP